MGRIPTIQSAPRDKPLPVSFSQERVWFLEQLEPGSIAYNAQFTVRFAGQLDVPVLERALSEIVRRHEILRTTFSAADGKPVQTIHPPQPVHVPTVDLRSAAPDRTAAVARRSRRRQTESDTSDSNDRREIAPRLVRA